MGLLRVPHVLAGVTIDPEALIGRAGDIVYDPVAKRFLGLDGDTPGGKPLNTTGVLYAEDYDVVDDEFVHLEEGWIDQTAAVQRFLDICSVKQRFPEFGALRVAQTGPLKLVHTGIGWDGFGTKFPQPGLWPKRLPASNRYTALTLEGLCNTGNISVRGTGEVTYDEDTGEVLTDTRTQVDGVQFGNAETYGLPFFGSWVANVSVTNLCGKGIRHVQSWDNVFGKQTVENCGTDTARGSHYAFSLDYNPTVGTVNESTYGAIQVETSCHRAIFVHPNTLSCTFSKIHSERAVAKEGVTTWLIGGGSNFYSAPRFQSVNAFATLHVVLGSTVVGLRVEGFNAFYNAAGEVLTFIGGSGTMRPLPGANGTVNISGWYGNLLGLLAGVSVTGSRLSTVEISGAVVPSDIVFTNCTIGTLKQIGVDDPAKVTITDCTVTDYQRVYHTVMNGGRLIFGDDFSLGFCRLDLNGGTIQVGDYDEDEQRHTGTLSLNTCWLNASGNWEISANLDVGANRQCTFGPDGQVLGTVTGFGPPIGAQIMPHRRGMTAHNIAAATAADPVSWRCTTVQSPGTPGTWSPIYSAAPPA